VIKVETLKSCQLIVKSYGKLPAGDFCYSTDTRSLVEGNGFLAIVGENFDGHNFIGKALELGASVVFFNSSKYLEIESHINQYPDRYFVECKDTISFIQELASHHLKWWRGLNPSAPVVAITGSNGKTTTKDMVTHLLNGIFGESVVSTEKNFNNHLGVPYTLLNICADTKAVVLEMGTNHPGELKVLCDIAQPSCGIITNIGMSHLEFFKNEEDVFKEKRVVFDSVMSASKNQGVFVVDGSDQHLKTLPAGKNVIFLCEGENLELNVKNAVLNVNALELNIENEHLTGAHNYFNLSAALSLCLALYPDEIENFKSGSKSFVPGRNRSSWVEHLGLKVFLDAYNANPSSMKASIKGFHQEIISDGYQDDQALYILGDMNELGPSSAKFHREMGQFASEQGVKNAIFVGKFAADYQKSFTGKSYLFEKISELSFKELSGILNGIKIVFVKGSRSLQLESFLDITP
jgi:UDP-N-acetylmuramoyl-tripeptide--D-alanyl-D-alanine ligase